MKGIARPKSWLTHPSQLPLTTFVCAACRDPEDPFLEVVPWGTWRSIVWRCVVLHVDGGHLAPLAHDLPGGCTTLLLEPRV